MRLLLLLLLAGCGGGSGPVPTLPETLRTDLRVGYYWGCPDFMLEQDSNLWWAGGGTQAAGCKNIPIAQEIEIARAAGIKHLVVMAQPEEIPGLPLAGFESVTVYPVDEPGSVQGGQKSDAEVTALVSRVRQALPTALVGVFYGCNDPKPGIKSFDVIGCFRYGSDGCSKLDSDYSSLRQQNPKAKLWLIPGGADIGNEGRQDPSCWAAYAHRNPDVVAVVGFIWQSVSGNPPLKGIRENGMKQPYCQMARTILGRGSC